MHDPQKFKNSHECFLKECPFCRSVQHWLLKETVENLKAANKCWLMFGRSLKSKISAFLKNASSNACYKMPIHDITRGNGRIKINFRFGKNHYKSNLGMYGQLSGLKKWVTNPNVTTCCQHSISIQQPTPDSRSQGDGCAGLYQKEPIEDLKFLQPLSR